MISVYCDKYCLMVVGSEIIASFQPRCVVVMECQNCCAPAVLGVGRDLTEAIHDAWLHHHP